MTDENTRTTPGLGELVVHTGAIVAAYLSGNECPASDVPQLIRTVHSALAEIAAGTTAGAAPVPACDPKKSVTHDYIVCLEDGRKLKSMKRHLATSFGMTPDDYRSRWGLPRNYPMVAPGYAKRRSDMAKEIGLGRVRDEVVPSEAVLSEAA